MNKKYFQLILAILCFLIVSGRKVEATMDDIPQFFKDPKYSGMFTDEDRERLDDPENDYKPSKLLPIKIDMSAYGADNSFEQYIIFGNTNSEKVGNYYPANTLENFRKIVDGDKTALKVGQYDVNSNPKEFVGYPNIITFLTDEYRAPNQRGVTYGYDYNSNNTDHHYYGGSGMHFVKTRGLDPRTSNLDSFSTTIGTPQERFQVSHVQMNKDKTRAFIIGSVWFKTNTSDGSFRYFTLDVGSVDNYGNIAYNYKIYNNRDFPESYGFVYTQHMDIGGVHTASKMRTLGNNKGVYFDAKADDNTKPTGLIDKNGNFHNYYVEFRADNEKGEKTADIKTIDVGWTHNEYMVPGTPSIIENIRMYPPAWRVFDTYRAVYTTSYDEDQPRGEIITRRDPYTGKILKQYNSKTGLDEPVPNAHPAFGLYYPFTTVQPMNFGEFKIEGAVSNVAPVNYPGMTIKTTGLSGTGNQLEKQHVTIEQSLEGELNSSARQPEQLAMKFLIDNKLFVNQIGEKDIKISIANKDGSDKKILENSWNGKELYTVSTEQTDKGFSYELRIRNDYLTGATYPNYNNGTQGFLWNHRENKKIIFEFDAELNELNPEIGSSYQYKPEPRGFMPKALLETSWNENITPDRIESNIQQQGIPFLFDSNIYKAEPREDAELDFRVGDAVEIRDLLKPISRNFDWEKPLKYELTNTQGDVLSNQTVNTTTSSASRTAYVKVTSPSLNNAYTPPIMVKYKVTARDSQKRVTINYEDVSNNNEAIDIPSEYPSFIVGQQASDMSFNIPDQIETVSGKYRYEFKEIKQSWNGNITTELSKDKTDRIVTGKMPTIEGKPLVTVSYEKKEGGLSEDPKVDGILQKFVIGQELTNEEFNPKDWITDVTYGNAVVNEKDYDVTIKDDSFLPDVIGEFDEEQTPLAVIVKMKQGTVKPVEVKIPVQMDYGNTVAIGGDEKLIDGKPRLGGGAFSYHPLNDQRKAYIKANSGAVLSNDNAPVHSTANSKDYLGINLYRPNKESVFDIMKATPVTTTGESSSNRSKNEYLKSFGDKGKQEVIVGDVLRAYSKEGEKLYLIDGENKETLSDKWKIKNTQYFELTENGYQRLYGNLAEVKEVEVPYDITDEELKKNVADYLDLTLVKSESPSVKVLGFKNVANGMPRLKKPGDVSVGIIEVSETLKSGAMVSYDYIVPFKASDEKSLMTGSIKYKINENAVNTPDKDTSKSVIKSIGEKDFDNDNPVRQVDEKGIFRKGEKLKPLLKEFEKEFNGYTKSDVYLYTSSDNSAELITTDTLVPDEDFEVVYYYIPGLILNVPKDTLSFGDFESDDTKIQGEDTSMYIVNTWENTKWNLTLQSTRFEQKAESNNPSDTSYIPAILEYSYNNQRYSLINQQANILQGHQAFYYDLPLVKQNEENGLYLSMQESAQKVRGGEYHSKLKATVTLDAP